VYAAIKRIVDVNAEQDVSDKMTSGAGLHWPSLTLALLIMVGGTLYPPIMAHPQGHADHGLAMALFWSMSSGFIRGVGFVPHLWLWRWLFSAWSCALGLALALALKLMH